MRIITFGSCLARYTAKAILRRQEGKLLGCVQHNRIDRFVAIHVDRTASETPREVLAGLEYKAGQEGRCRRVIENQYADGNLGRHGIHQTSPGFMPAVRDGASDLVILDNFLELRAKLMLPLDGSTGLFFPPVTVANAASFFEVGPHIEPQEAATNWVRLVAWLRLSLPRAKFVFLPFPGEQYEDKPQIGVTANAMWEALKVIDCPLLPVLKIPSENLLPNDRTHFAAAQYETYADLALSAAE